ncbi:S8 family serine peptidase [Bosea psychrotolerans]|uniref:Subtilisin family serine protease n=1 Tax=Bosea psychrotolerans TaxID=1871628 RepID=A0A2S4LWD0_9HYPH|nr:S8 family serine peptidase [Bosea psychrotolerans]POR46659.1 subtilisin family serine protease [Bosea psychrotolerans]
MSRLVDRFVMIRAGLRLRHGAVLALMLGLAAPVSGLRAQTYGARDFDYPATRQGVTRAQPALRGQTAIPTSRESAVPGRAYPGQVGRVETGRPGRPPRYPGRGGGWGPAAAGIGAGIIGGIILDQAMRRPVYDPYEPEPPQPRRPRRPIILDGDDLDEPVLRHPRRPAPARAAAPVRRTPPPVQTARPAPGQPRIIVPAASERRFVADEILVELAPNAQAGAVLRRHRATLMSSRRFDLAGVTIIRARLNDGRSARTVLSQMAGDARIASAQPNYLYALQQDAPKLEVPKEEAEKAAPESASAANEPAASPPAKVEEVAPVLAAPSVIAPPDLPPVAPLASVAPKRELQPQYVAETLHYDTIHKLARGDKIRVAVIDSGADLAHPELQGVLAGSFDAVGGDAAPHAHGTAMAGAILAQAQLQGVAPAARLLAARAFSGNSAPASANGTTYHILSALDWAAGEGARVVNLSFAGPQDRLLSRSLAGAKTKGIIAVAAAGNGGANAAPLYPGADPNVIAVTATDAQDKPFAQANRGNYIAVAAPGVDVLAAEPEGRYAFSSGTSIAAAHVSGLVALLLEKRPDLELEGVRKLLMESAIDLGGKGRSPIFGAGRVDAPAALARALPVSAARP